MIRHETIGMNLKSGLLAGFSQRLQEQLAILLYAKNRFAPIASTHDMINGSWKLDTDFSRHAQRRTPEEPEINKTTMLPLTDPFSLSAYPTSPAAMESAFPYFRECSPIMFPSVSYTSEMNPYCPIENLSLKIFPPLSAARFASTAQSSHVK